MISAVFSLSLGGCSKTESKPRIAPEPAELNATLAQQKMCADQAKKSMDDFNQPSPYAQTISSTFTNHFDPTTTTCYVEFFDSKTFDKGNTLSTYKLVSDAFEGRVCASYLWKSDKVKKYWEVAPMQCSIKPRKQTEITCHSGEEFDRLVLQYFGTGE
jgi:hypothetical protein